MDKKIVNLRDLLIEQGRELYDASLQEQLDLPRIQSKATNPQLRNLIGQQLDTAKDQKDRLQKAFTKLSVSPGGERNECCQSIFRQTYDLIDRSQDPEVRDAAIINAIQRLNHSKIALLGAMASYARETGYSDLAGSMHATLEKEKTLDQNLTALAEKEVNRKAVTATAP